MMVNGYNGGESCAECGEVVHVEDACPECFEEDDGAVVHDGCCELLDRIPYEAIVDAVRTTGVPTQDR